MDFPGGPVVKNLPANARDVGSIPILGGFHKLGSTLAHMPQLPRPMHPRAHVPKQEEPLHWDAWAPQLESSLHSLQLEKAPTQQRRPNTSKNKLTNKNKMKDKNHMTISIDEEQAFDKMPNELRD